MTSEPRPRIEVEYCTRCGWLPRAAWIAQEILGTFTDTVGEVALVPGHGGIFEVRVDGEAIFNRKESGRFVEPMELKQAIRDRIDPGRSLGHSDGTHSRARDDAGASDGG